jgi:hypothetical protein
MRKCRECGSDDINIVGTGFYGDTVEAECQTCGCMFEVGPDGFGEGGLEWVEAKAAELTELETVK